MVYQTPPGVPNPLEGLQARCLDEHEVTRWAISLPDGFHYLRAAVSTDGQHFLVAGQGWQTGHLWWAVVDALGGLTCAPRTEHPPRPAALQNSVAVRVGPSGWELVVTRSATLASRVRLSLAGEVLSVTDFAMPQTSQGVLGLSETGAPLWTDAHRTWMDPHTRRVLHLPARTVDVVVGQDGASNHLYAAHLTGDRSYRVLAQDGFEPHVARQTGGGYVVTSRTLDGHAAMILVDPPYPVDEAVSAPVTPTTPDEAPPPDVAPFGRPVHVGYFFRDTYAYGKNPLAPGNVTVVVGEARAALTAEPCVEDGQPIGVIIGPDAIETMSERPEDWARVVALYLASESSAKAIDGIRRKRDLCRLMMDTLGLPHVPFVVYTGEKPSPELADGETWIGLQLYLTGTQGADELRALAGRWLPELAHLPVALIGQAYDRWSGAGPQYTGDLAAHAPVHAELIRQWPNVRALLWFSDGRKGGTRDHEALRPWHRAIAMAARR